MKYSGGSSPNNQPPGYVDVDQRDADIDLLSRILCPIHLTPLILKKEVRLGGDDSRLRYGCSFCGVYVDFKDDELKSYSVGHALDVVNDMRINERGLTASKAYPTKNNGKKT